MKSMFKRREVFGAIVAVAAALVLIGCPGTTPGTLQVTANLADIEFPAGDMAARTVDLSKHFSTSRQNLTFEAESSMTAYVTASVSGSTLTVTPVAAGSSTVTVTADDGNETKSRSFAVTVMAPPPTPKPEITATIPTPITFMSVDAAPIARPLALFFSGAASYVITTEPMDQEVVGLALAEGVLTISPMGVGHAVVIITAVNAGGSVSQTIVVTVGAPPTPPPTAVTLAKDFASQTFEHDDTAARMFTLSDHFNGATSYMASSTDMMVVTAAEAGGVLTITPMGAGEAEVSITGTSDDDLSLTLTFHVTVKEAPKPPALVAGKSFMDLRLALDDGDAATTDEFLMSYDDLNTYLHDPDGITLDFSTMTSDKDIVAVYEKGTAVAEDGTTPLADAPLTAFLDKAEMTSATAITIHARKAGTAMISVKATDAVGLSTTETFMVTVIAANDAPEANADAIPEVTGDNILTGASRLKVGAVKKVKIDYAAHFADDDITGTNARADDDSWTLTARAIDDKVIMVSAMLTGAAGKPDEVEITITAVGGGSTMVEMKATDSFGKSATKTFDVQVNHRPQPYGAQEEEADRTTLGKYEGFMNLDASSTTAVTLPLFATDAGYFSDGDSGDTQTCSFLSSQHSVAAADRVAAVSMSANTLSVTPQKIGTMTIDVWCNDGYEDSEMARAMVEVDRGASIQ